MESDQINDLFRELVDEVRRGWTKCDTQVYRKILDCVPSAVFLVDSSARVIDMNAAAIELVGSEQKAIEKRLCGEVMRCVHAQEAKAGCGYAPACPCDVRVLIERACAGTPSNRHRASMKLVHDGVPTVRHLLVTAKPFEFSGCLFALLTLEDITEILSPRGG